MLVDVMDLCALLQCIGFKMKTLDNTELAGCNEQGVGRTVTIACNWSGMRVVLESNMAECNCPNKQNEHSSGFWQVSGVSHGVVENNKETGSSLIGFLPQSSKAKVTQELYKLIEYTRSHIEKQEPPKPEAKTGMTRCARFYDLNADQMPNVSASLTELNVTPPEARLAPAKVDTPTRYRSLDTLMNVKKPDSDLPSPGELVAKGKAVSDTSDIADDVPNNHRKDSYKRQQTYTMSTPAKKENVMMKSKTSSPITKVSEAMLQSLLNAEKMAEDLRNKLVDLLKGFSTDDDKPDDSSVVSLVLDVSKISVAKGHDPSTKSKFISSPNLSGYGSKRHNTSTSTLKRVESSSTSQLNTLCEARGSLKAPSKLKRLSPSFYRLKKDDSLLRPQSSDGTYRKLTEKQQSKLSSIVKPRASIGGNPVRTPLTKSAHNDIGMSLSTTKKKMYSHVKSTIPKPTFMLKKE